MANSVAVDMANSLAKFWTDGMANSLADACTDDLAYLWPYACADLRIASWHHGNAHTSYTNGGAI
jgi:hypothetical protein